MDGLVVWGRIFNIHRTKIVEVVFLFDFFLRRERRVFKIRGTDPSLYRNEIKLQHSVVTTLVTTVDENTNRDTHSHEICRFWNRKGKVINTSYEPAQYMNPRGYEHTEFPFMRFSYMLIAITNGFEQILVITKGGNVNVLKCSQSFRVYTKQ